MAPSHASARGFDFGIEDCGVIAPWSSNSQHLGCGALESFGQGLVDAGGPAHHAGSGSVWLHQARVEGDQETTVRIGATFSLPAGGHQY